MSPAPISASTASTWPMRSSRRGSAASTTCSSRSASRASDSVERKAATRSCGRSRTKPTVSDERQRAGGAVHAPHGRVERREQLVRGVHARAGQRVEQRRLAGVGVADEGDRAALRCARARGASACAALRPSPAAPRALAPLLQQAAVGLQARLAGAAQADRAAALAVEVGAARTSRAAMCLQLRELDLQLAFVRDRALREDVEDQAGAVDDAALRSLARLRSCTGLSVWLNSTRSAPVASQAALEFLDLAAADVVRGGRLLDARRAPADHLGAGGARQLGELVQRVCVMAAGRMRLHQQRAFAAGARVSAYLRCGQKLLVTGRRRRRRRRRRR